MLNRQSHLPRPPVAGNDCSCHARRHTESFIMPVGHRSSFRTERGSSIAAGSVMLLVSLRRRTRSARLRTALLGGVVAACG